MSKNPSPRKAKVSAFTYLIPLVLIPGLCAIAPILSVVFVYLYILYLLVKDDSRILFFFIAFCAVQNMTLIVFANNFDTTTTTLFSLSKEIMLYLYVVKGVLTKKIPLKSHFVLFLLFVGVLALSFFVSDADMYSKILTIRQMLLPFVCLYFGYCYYSEKRNAAFDQQMKLVIGIGAVIAIFGLLEFFVLKDNFWFLFNMARYEENKGTTFDFYKGVPLNFYTWDFKDLTGNVVRRLVSFMADPLITAHYLFLCFVLCGLVKIKFRRVLRLLFFVTCLLTLSKSAIVLFVVYFLFFLAKHFSYKTVIRLALIGVLAAIVSIPIVLSILYSVVPNSSLVIHLNGFINGILGSSLLGEGIGKAGVIVAVKANIDRLTGESYIGTLSIQLGYIGLALFLAFYVVCALILLREYYRTKNKFFLAADVLLVAVILESFLSESSIGVVGSGLYFVLAGLGLGWARTNRLRSLHERKQSISQHAC